MPELSIILTCFNLERYLEASVQSVLQQTLTDTEIIIVDDGSTDSSPEIITRIANLDARIVPLLLKESSPGGVATAANAGLDRASAPYVGFVDGDDLCEPVMFEKLLIAARAADSDLAMCNYKVLDDGSGQLSDPADRRRWRELDADYYELNVLNSKRFLRFVAVPWRKIYRREMLESNSIRFPVVDYFFEDNPFHWFSILSARSIALVLEPLCYHRVARAGQTMETADGRLFEMFSHHDTIQSWLKSQKVDAVYTTSLVEWVISQLEWISSKTPRRLRRELFQTVHRVLGAYQAATIEEALRQGKKGPRGRKLARAAHDGSLADFNRVLDRGSSPSALQRVAYRLRYDGLWTSVRKGSGDAWSRAEGPAAGETPEVAGLAEGKVRNKDLMFALLLLERKLGAIDDRIRLVEAEVQRLRDDPDQ